MGASREGYFAAGNQAEKRAEKRPGKGQKTGPYTREGKAMFFCARNCQYFGKNHRSPSK